MPIGKLFGPLKPGSVIAGTCNTVQNRWNNKSLGASSPSGASLAAAGVKQHVVVGDDGRKFAPARDSDRTSLAIVGKRRGEAAIEKLDEFRAETIAMRFVFESHGTGELEGKNCPMRRQRVVETCRQIDMSSTIAPALRNSAIASAMTWRVEFLRLRPMR